MEFLREGTPKQRVTYTWYMPRCDEVMPKKETATPNLGGGGRNGISTLLSFER